MARAISPPSGTRLYPTGLNFLLPEVRFSSQLSFQRNCYPSSGCAQGCISEMDVAVGRAGPSVPKQVSRDVQAFALHDRVRSMRVARPSSSSRATSPNRNCLGPVFESVRIKRSGLTSDQHRRNRRRRTIRLRLGEHCPGPRAVRASSTVSASRVPNVRLPAEPLQRRCTIHVLRPVVRAHRPSPHAALSHSAAVRPRLVDLRSVRHVPIPSVRLSCARRGPGGPQQGNTQDTPDNEAGLEDRKGRTCCA